MQIKGPPRPEPLSANSETGLRQVWSFVLHTDQRFGTIAGILCRMDLLEDPAAFCDAISANLRQPRPQGRQTVVKTVNAVPDWQKCLCDLGVSFSGHTTDAAAHSIRVTRRRCAPTQLKNTIACESVIVGIVQCSNLFVDHVCASGFGLHPLCGVICDRTQRGRGIRLDDCPRTGGLIRRGPWPLIGW